MDTQLQELIDRIKSEGIKEANSEADKIISEAKKKANDIVSKAHDEASTIVADAKSEAAKMENSGREALKQAGRDLVLSLKAEIIRMFDAVIKDQAGQALRSEGLKDAVVALLSAWGEGKPDQLDLLLPESELENVESGLRAELAESFKQGVELKPVHTIDSGFRISMQDGSVYYNFTAEGIAEIIAEYVNPRLSALLKEAAEEGVED